MTQRGFISSLGLYAIMAVVVAGMGYALYYQIQKNGKLEESNKTLKEDKKTLQDQIESQNKAQLLAQRLKEKAEQDAARTHRQLAQLRKEHEKLLSLVVPDGLVIGLFNVIAETNGDLSPGQSYGTDKTPVPKITLGSLYEWATEAVPEALKRCNADKQAIRQLCQNTQ